MPVAKPRTSVTATAARTWERVSSDGSQTPSTPIAAIARTAVSAVRQVPISQASAATTNSTAHQGSHCSPERTGSRTQVVKCPAQSAVPPTTGTPEYRWAVIQSTARFTGSAKFRVHAVGQSRRPRRRAASATATVAPRPYSRPTVGFRVSPRSPAAAVMRSSTTASSTIGTPAARAAPTSTDARAW
ncbi:reductive dehalogenase domain-containing protein [Streptomyces sp900105755]|uniref:reductive dehalogenase domain-containing protein n=1 Tax=Streptomyces sp. 900105755 TaxID=3154389 RepID=UPI00331F1B2C